MRWEDIWEWQQQRWVKKVRLGGGEGTIRMNYCHKVLGRKCVFGSWLGWLDGLSL